MCFVITLYHLENEEIKISIEARFEGESLVIDGYDIGKRVEEYWGDSDYEYTTTIQPENVQRLYTVLQVPSGDKKALLECLASTYHTNSCYSEIQRLLDDHHIPYEGFSWT